MAFFPIPSSWQGKVLSILRMISAADLMQHGGQKMLGFPQVGQGQFQIFSLMGLAGVLELFGGLLLLVGLFTRKVAFVLSGFMAVAYFMHHAPSSFWPLVNGGELSVILCFVYLFLSAAGGGDWSLDKKLRKG